MFIAFEWYSITCELRRREIIFGNYAGYKHFAPKGAFILKKEILL
jgi:hypothetical protein